MELNTKTTKYSNLPDGIIYKYDMKLRSIGITKIIGFKSLRDPIKQKSDTSFSIYKFGLEIAYRKAIKHFYGEDKVEEILEKCPVPYIHPDDLFAPFKKRNYVYGISPKFNLKGNSWLIGFVVTTKGSKINYISIRKLGLEKAWEEAVKRRYVDYCPLHNDKPELPLEYWDMINPKYRIKSR